MKHAEYVAESNRALLCAIATMIGCSLMVGASITAMLFEAAETAIWTALAAVGFAIACRVEYGHFVIAQVRAEITKPKPTETHL